MSTERPQAPPVGLKANGRGLWSSITDDYDLEEHERALLAQAARVVDLLDELDEVVRREGAMVTGPQGLIAHPAAKEARAQASPWPACSPRCACRPGKKATSRDPPAPDAPSAAPALVAPTASAG